MTQIHFMHEIPKTLKYYTCKIKMQKSVSMYLLLILMSFLHTCGWSDSSVVFILENRC